MLAYFVRKLLMMIPMVIIITFLMFCALEVMPGDAVTYMVGPDQMANVSPERLDMLRETLGLNDPFFLRYFQWLGNLFTGNFGYSLTSGVSIKDIILDKLPATLELSIAALLISTIIGNLLGILGALKKGSIKDNVITVAGIVGLSIPEFFFGLICLLIFAINLRWLPVGGRILPSYVSYFDHMKNLVMPACVLGIAMTAGLMRFARSSMLDSINKDYIRTARSKGLPEWRVNLVHGFRVALSPIVVLIGFRLTMLVGGSVVIEEIFQWPGMGRELISSIRGQNSPVVMTIVLLYVILVLVISFLIDLITALLDPRVRLK